MGNSSLCAFRGSLVLPDRVMKSGVLLCEGDRIVSVKTGKRAPRDAEPVDVDAGWIVPGFVEIHVHGGDGADFMDGTVEAVRTAIRSHTRHGTTSIYPTTTTGTPEQLDAMLKACAAVQREWNPSMGARLQGVHFYGPYFAADKVGAHAPQG